MSAPSNREAIGRYPALLARGGFHRQAIHGLSVKSSASLPRPARTRAPALTPRAAMPADPTGGNTNPPQKRRPSLGFLPPPPPWGGGGWGGGRVAECIAWG